MLDAVLLENLGLPTITVVQDQFEKAARMHAAAAGLPDVPLFVEPTPIDGSSVQRDVAGFVADHMDDVVRALTSKVVAA
jgi:hypothetical protein